MKGIWTSSRIRRQSPCPFAQWFPPPHSIARYFQKLNKTYFLLTVNPDFTVARAERVLQQFDKRTDLRRYFSLTSNFACMYLLISSLLTVDLKLNPAQWSISHNENIRRVLVLSNRNWVSLKSMNIFFSSISSSSPSQAHGRESKQYTVRLFAFVKWMSLYFISIVNRITSNAWWILPIALKS